MNWLDKQIWKKCFIATFICLLGCSIGAIGIAYFMMGYHWLLVLSISVVVGYISCIIFMIAWSMLFRKMNFKDSFKHSNKMSLVSILIMMLTENLIMFLIHSQHSMPQNISQNLPIMSLAMGAGFILALPYNYYVLSKTGKVCHA